MPSCGHPIPHHGSWDGANGTVVVVGVGCDRRTWLATAPSTWATLAKAETVGVRDALRHQPAVHGGVGASSAWLPLALAVAGLFLLLPSPTPLLRSNQILYGATEFL